MGYGPTGATSPGWLRKAGGGARGDLDADRDLVEDRGEHGVAALGGSLEDQRDQLPSLEDEVVSVEAGPARSPVKLYM